MSNLFEALKGVLNGEQWALPSWIERCEDGSFKGKYLSTWQGYGWSGEETLCLRTYPDGELIGGFCPRIGEIESEAWSRV